MFAVVKKEKRKIVLIAYHNEKRVVKKYLESIKDKDSLKILKTPNEWIEQQKDYEDLYLIRYGKTFVQCGYYEYIYEDYRTNLSELYLTKDVLMKLFEVGDFDQKEKRTISKTIQIIAEAIDNEEEAIPSLEELKQIKEHVESFRYHISDLEYDDPKWFQ